MGCILNRERSVPFHSRNGAIPSKTCSIKTPPLLLLFFFFFFFPPQRFFHVRRLEQFLIRSPKPIPPPSRSRSLALFFLFFFLLYICSSCSTPVRFIFFFSILRKRRIPLTRTSNQGFLRSRNPSFFSHCRIELSFLSTRFFFSHIPTLPLFP